MLYLLQVTVYSALLYSVYLLVLKNRASHNWNRLYLLLCAILPLIIPFVRIPAFSDSIPVSTGALNLQLQEIAVFTKAKAHTEGLYNWSGLLIAAYSLVALAILLRSIIQYIAFKRFVRQNKYEVVNNTKVLLNTNAGPGSFQNYIFLPDDTIDPAIFEHELAHIKLKHSSDILLLRLLRAIFWPNIVLYAISSELKIVHEFQADAYAVQNKEAYITTLLNDTFNTTRFALPHTFFYHPLKRRIMMLQKSPLSRIKLRIAMLKTGFLAAILLAGIVYLQSCKQQLADLKQNADVRKSSEDTAAEKATIMNQMIHDQVPIKGQSNNGPVFNYTDKMPQVPYDLSAYLSTHIKYPEAARKMKIAGRVIVKFVVDENGNVVNPIILRGVDPSLDAEALRVVSSMPQWIPGEKDGKKVPVYFNLPISFQLN